jgi:hypothetical protein
MYRTVEAARVQSQSSDVQWTVQWTKNGPVVPLEHLYDSEESSCLRLALCLWLEGYYETHS